MQSFPPPCSVLVAQIGPWPPRSCASVHCSLLSEMSNFSICLISQPVLPSHLALVFPLVFSTQAAQIEPFFGILNSDMCLTYHGHWNLIKLMCMKILGSI